MNIVEEIDKIIENHHCKCYNFSKDTLTLHSKLSPQEYRVNTCNHRVFAEITGFLALHDISFEVTSSHDIIIKPSA